MKVLFIGGTGNISSKCSEAALQAGIDLYLLNRGASRRLSNPERFRMIRADIRNVAEAAEALRGHSFDVVVDWIAFTPQEIETDLSLFRNRTRQFIFISTASVYQKPPRHPVVTESTPLRNPYWEYSRQKIDCELRLMQAHREEGFPVTIVRPSHTYNTIIPIAVGRSNYTIANRILSRKKIIVPGDGTSLWTVTHAEDFARGFTGLLGNVHAIGHSFHITSDEILTWNQIYEIIGEALGVAPNIVHIPTDFISQFGEDLKGPLMGDRAWSVIFDNTKIKRFVPGFQATIYFAAGIRQTIAWFQEEESRREVDTQSEATIDRIVEAFEQGGNSFRTASPSDWSSNRSS
jgi:nucleoside-diphosphate-sugar epimerase